MYLSKIIAAFKCRSDIPPRPGNIQRARNPLVLLCLGRG